MRGHVATVAGRRKFLPGRTPPTTTYIARCGDYVKVGCASDVTARLNVLSTPSGRRQLMCPADLPDEPLTLLGTLPGGYDTETQVIANLIELDAQVVGEWFRAAPDVLAWIERHSERTADGDGAGKFLIPVTALAAWVEGLADA